MFVADCLKLADFVADPFDLGTPSSEVQSGQRITQFLVIAVHDRPTFYSNV